MKRVRFRTGNTGHFGRVKGTKLGVDFAQVGVLVAPSEMQIDLAIVVRSFLVGHSYWILCIWISCI